MIGAALTAHRRSVIFRKQSTQLEGIIQRVEEILRTRNGFNSQKNVWRYNHKIIEFGHTNNPGDEIAWQGRAHDLVGFDEITHFSEYVFRFLIGWNRGGKRNRVICTGNPPTTAEGDWIISYWGPWLDPDHPNPAVPGELRWYTTNEDGVDIECPNGEPVEIDGEMVKPRSRTFIPSSVDDNPYLLEAGYKSQLQALPEPLRSALLKGQFGLGQEDDPWQVIPTEWIKAAQARWVERVDDPMDSVGVDIARGGNDQTVICCRRGRWFGQLDCYPGQTTPDGPAVAGLVVTRVKDKAPIHVDIIGVGSSVYDHLEGLNVHTIGVNNASGSKALDKTKQLKFLNKRAETYWKLREALDPDDGDDLMLPPDKEMLRDLAAPRWSLGKSGIKIESKEEIIKRIGRSPDRGDAVVLANIDTPKKAVKRAPRRVHNGAQGWMS